MSQQDCDPSFSPQPTEQHRVLQQKCGRWQVECTYFVGTDEPLKTEAVETLEMFGPFFTVSVFESNMFGTPFSGRATTGYEPSQDRWVATWIDTMTPNLFYMTGRFDDSTRSLNMTGEGVDPSTGGMTSYRSVERMVADDEREFEMFMTPPGGQEMQIMRYVYRRA